MDWINDIIDKHREPDIILKHWRTERFDYYPPEFLSEFYGILDVVEQMVYSTDRYQNSLIYQSEPIRLKIDRVYGVYRILEHNNSTRQENRTLERNNSTEQKNWLNSMIAIKTIIDTIPGEFEWKYYFLKIII